MFTIHPLAVKNKAKQDAVLKFLFITDMWFYKGTTFTSSFVLIHWKYLLTPLFSYTFVNALYSPENRRITLQRNCLLWPPCFFHHWHCVVMTTLIKSVTAVHKLCRYENKMMLKIFPTCTFALNHGLVDPAKVTFLRSSCVMINFTGSPLHFKLEIIALCQYYLFKGFDSCILSVLAFGEGFDSWMPLQGHDFQFV